VLDDESGESMESMEEVSLKEFGDPESGASRGIFVYTYYILKILGGKL